MCGLSPRAPSLRGRTLDEEDPDHSTLTTAGGRAASSRHAASSSPGSSVRINLGKAAVWPAAGGPALGVPLSELLDQRVVLADLRCGDARRLPGTLDPDTALARTLDVAASLVAGGPADPEVTWAVSLLRNPRARAEDVAAEVGLSLRQLRRRCHAAVGYGPKTLQRVLRFRRFISRIDADRGAGDLAAVAAQAGYADQAHLTRECGQLAGLTPAALARQRVSG
jgi:AraC-like DNA-binding protein